MQRCFWTRNPPCRAHYRGSKLQAPQRAQKTLRQGCRSRAQHWQSTDTNTGRALLPEEALRAEQSHGRDTAGLTWRDSTGAPCRKGSHSTAPVSPKSTARAGTGCWEHSELGGQNRATAAQLRDLGHFSKRRPPPPCQRPNLLSTRLAGNRDPQPPLPPAPKLQSGSFQTHGMPRS